MYEIIKNPEIMSKESIKANYKGKWVYIVKAIITPHGELVEGMPVVCGEYQFEGVEEGIYKQFDGEEYEEKLSYTLIPHSGMISSVYGIGEINDS